MNISNLLSYKVVEFDKGLCIIPAIDQLGGRQGITELIIADIATCCEYLIRYTHARAKGHSIPHAHDEALKGAIVVKDFAAKPKVVQ